MLDIALNLIAWGPPTPTELKFTFNFCMGVLYRVLDLPFNSDAKI